MRFRIVFLCGHAERYIGACIDSYLCQCFQAWDAVVMIDPMGDGTYQVAKRYESDRIKVKNNEIRQFALGNTVEGILLLDPADDDVIVTMDGDDWLMHPHALSIVAAAYSSNTDVLLTHGSWKAWPNPNVPENNESYTEEEFKGNIRKVRWKASQLRTFKYRLWKHVLNSDLRDDRGDYFKAAGDCAYMWPMMEMAGYHRVQFIPDRIYVYNQENPHGDSVENVRQQMSYTDYIASKPQYDYREDI